MSLPTLFDTLDPVCPESVTYCETWGNDWGGAWLACPNGAWMLWTVSMVGASHERSIGLLRLLVGTEFEAAKVSALENATHLTEREWSTNASNIAIAYLNAQGLTGEARLAALLAMAVTMRAEVTTTELIDYVEAL